MAQRGRHGRPGLPRGVFGLAALLAAGAAALLAGAPRAGGAEPFTGVEGVAALGRDLAAGVAVFAFDRAGAGPGDRPVAVSAPTGADGRYRLALAPGQYHLLALTARDGRWRAPAPGDLFAYHLGSPVAVERGRVARVAFSLVRVPPPAATLPDQGAGISGAVTFAGRPLGRAYVYVYRDAGNAFRGMGDAVVPAGEDGAFRVRLAPGRYWVIARKRLQGGMYGPPGKDDYVGYYPGNPIEVAPGRMQRVALETTTRVDAIEEALGAEAGRGWVGGRVVDGTGAAVGGLYVLLYAPGQTLTGAPAKVAGPTAADGSFRVPSDGARYRVVARANLGGPPEEGEWYGAWRGTRGEEELALTASRTVTIRVERHRGGP